MSMGTCCLMHICQAANPSDEKAVPHEKMTHLEKNET